jgi:hypothetical protein
MEVYACKVRHSVSGRTRKQLATFGRRRFDQALYGCIFCTPKPESCWFGRNVEATRVSGPISTNAAPGRCLGCFDDIPWVYRVTSPCMWQLTRALTLSVGPGDSAIRAGSVFTKTPVGLVFEWPKLPAVVNSDGWLHGTEIPVYGEQPQSACNGDFEVHMLSPLRLFNREDDCLAPELRPGEVHGADDREELLLPDRTATETGQGGGVRADAALAKPEILTGRRQGHYWIDFAKDDVDAAGNTGQHGDCR